MALRRGWGDGLRKAQIGKRLVVTVTVERPVTAGPRRSPLSAASKSRPPATVFGRSPLDVLGKAVAALERGLRHAQRRSGPALRSILHRGLATSAVVAEASGAVLSRSAVVAGKVVWRLLAALRRLIVDNLADTKLAADLGAVRKHWRKGDFWLWWWKHRGAQYAVTALVIAIGVLMIGSLAH